MSPWSPRRNRTAAAVAALLAAGLLLQAAAPHRHATSPSEVSLHAAEAGAGGTQRVAVHGDGCFLCRVSKQLRDVWQPGALPLPRDPDLRLAHPDRDGGVPVARPFIRQAPPRAPPAPISASNV